MSTADANYVNADYARRYADLFLKEYGLYSNDAVFYEVISDTTGSQVRGVSTASVAEDEVVANWQVIYTRLLPTSIVNAAGATQPITFTVVGPGAKLKVYEPVLPQVSSDSVAGLPMPLGVQGGWRAIQPRRLPLDAAEAQAITTSIVDTATVEALYLSLDDAVTLNAIPLDIVKREILSATIAYWEAPAGSQQGQLFPVYELLVRFTESSGAVSEDFVYIPASPQFLRPLAKIISPPLAATSGISVTFTAADPAKSPKANGVANFDFVFAYDPSNPDFTIEWYLGDLTSAGANVIPECTGLLTCTFKAPSDAGDKPEPFTVSLRVVDNTSPNASESSDVAQVTLNNGTFLPTVTK